MFGKLWKKCVNYETISYLVCGVLTTAVDFVSYTAFRKMSMGVGVSQTLSWVAERPAPCILAPVLSLESI